MTFTMNDLATFHLKYLEPTMKKPVSFLHSSRIIETDQMLLDNG